MKVYEGLKSNNAVKVGDSYIVQLAWNTTLFIDGIELRNGSDQIVLNSLDDIYQVKQPSKTVSHYENADGETLPVTEMRKFRTKWENYLDEDDSFIGTPEEELQYVKDKIYYQSFQPVFKESEKEYVPIEITVVGEAVDTGSEFIQTPYSIGKLNHPGGGVFKVLLGRIVRDELTKITKHLKVDVPTHSNIKYVKVNGEYLFTNMRNPAIENADTFKVVKTLEEAKDLEASWRKKIDNVVKLAVDDEEISELHRKEVYRSLGGIKNLMQQIDAKAKSADTHRHALKNISDLIQRVEDNFEEEA